MTIMLEKIRGYSLRGKHTKASYSKFQVQLFKAFAGTFHAYDKSGSGNETMSIHYNCIHIKK